MAGKADRRAATRSHLRPLRPLRAAPWRTAHADDEAIAGDRWPPLRRARALLGVVAAGLEAEAAGADDERAVVVGVVVEPHPWLPVVGGAGREGGGVEGIDLGPRAGAERQVLTHRRDVRGAGPRQPQLRLLVAEAAQRAELG